MSAIFDWLAVLPPWLVIAAVVLLPALEASTFLGLVIPAETAVIRREQCRGVAGARRPPRMPTGPSRPADRAPRW